MADEFRKQANVKNGKHVKGFTPELTKWMFRQRWEGNVRQLKNVVESLIVMDIDQILDMDDLSPDLLGDEEQNKQERKSAGIEDFGTNALVGKSLKDIEHWAIEQTLKLASGNREETAGILGISERNLYRKLKEYGLS